MINLSCFKPMTLKFFNQKRWGIDPALFSKTLERVRALFPDENRIVSLIFVDDPTIHQLNSKYLHRDCATDVLSFTYDDPVLLGELYVSVHTVKKQARDYEQRLPDELNKIFVHGFLHLKGYTHNGIEDKKEMNTLEDKILYSFA